ncbi:outer membrane protein assembly factor BamD [Candidatus Latescibacterota bacterium]
MDAVFISGIMGFFYMRYISKHVFYLLLCVCFASACSPKMKIEEEPNADFYFNRGLMWMEKKDYLKAIADFQTVVESYQVASIVDNAQFKLAEAHFMSEDYITAAYEYERVYVDYTSSRFAPEAQYKKALCYYMESPKAQLDQENTQLAIDEFNRFIDNYPRQPLVEEAQKKIEELRAKLAYKEYLNAEHYKKTNIHENHLNAALISYRQVINEYPRTGWADYSRYGIGEVYFIQKEFGKAREMFLWCINNDVDKDLKEKASKMLAKIEQIE